jgi:hypothetical protein
MERRHIPDQKLVQALLTVGFTPIEAREAASVETTVETAMDRILVRRAQKPSAAPPAPALAPVHRPPASSMQVELPNICCFILQV